jgi:dihydropteroate synthase
LRRSTALAGLGYPLLLSASNKTFLGVILDLEITERREATAAAHALGISLGCRVVRAHDVRGTCRVRDMLAAILEARSEGGRSEGGRSEGGRSEGPLPDGDQAGGAR